MTGNFDFVTPPSRQNNACEILHPDIRIIAAIDFGTTHSGCAMIHVNEEDRKIITCNRWKDQPGVAYEKNLTCIRYDSNGDVTSWGYSGRCSESSEDKIFERFKLYLDPDFDTNKMHGLPPLSQSSVVKIIADYLRQLYVFFIENYLHKQFDNLFDDSILWVLTVPAMWDERAKQMMTEAAIQAGIISPQDANDKGRFNIVLEPEAAAMICCEISSETNLKAGDNFIVVDAGGGTVDLTAYHVSKNVSTGLENLKELCDGIGGCCGSAYVDNFFFAFLDEKCGSEAVAEYRENNPRSWFQNIVQQWESLKRKFKGPETFEDGHPKGISIPHALRKHMSEEDVEELEDNDGEIKISLADMTAMFDPIVEEIIGLIETQLSKCKNYDINRMFLVGGFACNSYLFEAIKKHFKGRFPNMNIIRPTQPGSAVLCGAVLSGLNQRFIDVRCARSTYGVKVSGIWTSENPATEEEKFLNEYDGETYATNLFHTMVVKGQQIDIDDYVSERYVPTEVNQTHAKVEIYETENSSVKYIPPTKKPVGNLLVPISFFNENAEDQPLRAPMRINIIQDVSYSMTLMIETCKTEIRRLSEIIDPNDEVGLMEFACSVNILSDISTSPITASEIPSYVNAMQIKNHTALYDAICEGVRTLETATKYRPDPRIKNILIVYTDGEENASSTSFDVLSATLKNHKIPNFRFIFANAAKYNENIHLIDLCRQSPFCNVLSVENSKEGITAAFKVIRRDIQVFRDQSTALANKSVELKLFFGESKIKAEAVCPSTGQTRACRFELST